jgi:NAD(P)-dependent dehydrogenase (short-subunit alcohol dehydrogenase family)
MTILTKEFQGKIALITGGARNIGKAVAQMAASRGAIVVLADICADLKTIPYRLSTRDDLRDAVEELSRQGTEAVGKACDVRSEPEVRTTVEEVMQQFGRIDFLVNNAGVVSLSTIQEISETAWHEVVDTCLKGTFLCCKHVVPHMIERGFGKIVNVSSIAGVKGMGLGVHYSAAKHGVIGLTRALAMEVADHNINVNAVCPGTTESPMLKGLASQASVSEEPYAHFARFHLFQDRKISPMDVAHTVSWLLSEESRCMTGAVVTVDAGWSARM